MKTTNHFKKTVQEYLQKRAQEDELFAPRFANPNKNIDDCVTFIMNTVKRMANELDCYGLTDDEVFSLALHYYDEDDIEVGEPMECQVVVNHTIQLTEKDIAKARKDAMDRIEREAYADIKRRHEKKVKKAESLSTAKPTTKVIQQNLF